jgi:hypothetical protein
VIIDDDHVKRARVVLRQQGRDRLRDHVGLIARGHDRHHGGPAAGRFRDGQRRGGTLAPETAAREEQHAPDQERDARQHK